MVRELRPYTVILYHIFKKLQEVFENFSKYFFKIRILTKKEWGTCRANVI
jgi:hypothetical protein